MKISKIQTRNFLGARDVDMNLRQPVTIIAGANGSGKSSIGEAIRHALVGEPTRVVLKKDYAKLLTDGAKAGYAIVEYDGGRAAITLPNGTHEVIGGAPPACLPFVLDAQRFSRLSNNDRRSFLFGLMGLRTDGESIRSRILDKGCDPLKVDQIRTHLRAVFDAAHQEARNQARESKSAWRAVTGETYGSVKAATWVAPKPAFSADRLCIVRNELALVAQQVESCVHALGDMQGRAKLQAEQSAKLAGLRERARGFSRIEAKLRKDEEERKEWQSKCEHEARAVSGKQMPVEPTYTCPACSVVLRHSHANGALVEFTPPPVVGTSDPGKLAEYQQARDLLARSVANDQRDLADADAAAKMLAEIEDAQSAPAPAPEEIDAAKAQVEALKKSRSALQETVKTLEQDERAASQADSKTAAASGHHDDVSQWEAIADALAPEGIPGEMLAEALEPINQRLESSAHMTEWACIRIDSDMGIAANGRSYSLLSESEKWRTDAMISEAVSHLSGVRLLVLDRFDVLDLPGREDLLYWIDGLAEQGEIHTAILFGTLKAIPAKLPGTVEAHWIKNGSICGLKEVA